MVGAEPHAPYNRVLLSAALAGEIGDDESRCATRAGVRRPGFRLLTGRRVASLDLAGAWPCWPTAARFHFDRAVFATGSTAVRLPVPGIDLRGVMTFRDLADLPRCARRRA